MSSTTTDHPLISRSYFSSLEEVNKERLVAVRAAGPFSVEEEQLLVQHVSAQVHSWCIKAEEARHKQQNQGEQDDNNIGKLNSGQQGSSGKQDKNEEANDKMISNNYIKNKFADRKNPEDFAHDPGWPIHAQELGITIPYVATLFFRAFYSRRSIVGYNPEVLMLTCLMLATKVEEVRGGPDWFPELCGLMRAGTAGDGNKDNKKEDPDVVEVKKQKLMDSVISLEPDLLEGINFQILVEKPFAIVQLLLEDYAENVGLDTFAESARLDAVLYCSVRVIGLIIVVGSFLLGDVDVLKVAGTMGKNLKVGSESWWDWILRNVPEDVVVSEEEKDLAMEYGKELEKNVRTKRDGSSGSTSPELTKVLIKLKELNRSNRLKKRKTEG